MRTLVVYLLAQAVAITIATLGIVVIPFAVIGRWPPQELLICSSIGGAMSPFWWRMYRAVRGYTSGPTDAGDSEQQP
jgi:hypothetical protein